MQSYDLRHAAGTHLGAAGEDAATETELTRIRQHLMLLRLKHRFPHLWLLASLLMLLGMYFGGPGYSCYFLVGAAALSIIAFLCLAKDMPDI